MNSKNGAGPPGSGGRHGKSGGQPQGKQVDTLSPVAPFVKDKDASAGRRTVGREVPAPYFKVPDFLLRFIPPPTLPGGRRRCRGRKESAGLTLGDVLLWGFLARGEPSDGATSEMEIRNLSDTLRCSMRTVYSSLKRLEAAGLLGIRQRPGRASVYCVLIPAEVNTYAKIAGVTPPETNTPAKIAGVASAKVAGDLGKKAQGTSAKFAADPRKNCRATEVQLRTEKTGRTGRPPAPSLHGTENGNGGHQGESDPDAALEVAVKNARGKPLTDNERPYFQEEVAKARKAGATDGMLAAEIKGLDRQSAAWDPVRIAAENARRLRASYQVVAKLSPPRSTVEQILDDVAFARRKLAQNPRADRLDQGVAHWHAQVEWADVHAGELDEARGGVELVAEGVLA